MVINSNGFKNITTIRVKDNNIDLLNLICNAIKAGYNVDVIINGECYELYNGGDN